MTPITRPTRSYHALNSAISKPADTSREPLQQVDEHPRSARSAVQDTGLLAASAQEQSSMPQDIKTPLSHIALLVKNGGGESLMQEWQSFITSQPSCTPLDINAFVQYVLRESYLSNTQDLQFHAQKVRFFNELKQNIRDELSRLRGIQAELAVAFKPDGSVDLSKLSSEDKTAIDKALDPGVIGGIGVVNYADTPDENGRVIRAADDPKHPELSSDYLQNWDSEPGIQEKLGASIQAMEQKLNSVGDDAQLANIDLQNILQKQQQAINSMTNISKLMFDLAMRIIGNFK